MSSAPRLHSDDLHMIAELVADFVLVQLRNGVGVPQAPHRRRLLDASEVAEMLGVGRNVVYRRADEFGAVRIGAGPRPRLRFDPAKVTEALEACSTGRESGGTNRPPRKATSRSRAPKSAAAFPLLPVRGVE